MRHLRAMLFDARVHDKWSYEQLPMVQRIMNTVEKTSTGVIPAELILNNSIRLSNRILAPGFKLNVAQGEKELSMIFIEDLVGDTSTVDATKDFDKGVAVGLRKIRRESTIAGSGE